MQNGTIEQAERSGARLSVLKFDRYVFDLDQYAGPQRGYRSRYQRALSSRTVRSRNSPEPIRTCARGVYLAEAHNRLSAPLYCIAFALIALAATAKGRMARASYALAPCRARPVAARRCGLSATARRASRRAARTLVRCSICCRLARHRHRARAILTDVPLMPEQVRGVSSRASAGAQRHDLVADTDGLSGAAISCRRC